MLSWLMQNLGTILICLALCAVVICIILSMRKDRKKGKSACGCNCGHCPMSGACHKQ